MSAAAVKDAGTCQRVRLLLNKDGGQEVSAVPCPELAGGGREDSGEPARVGISAKKTDSTDPFLYHKTTRRQLYDTERENFLADGFLEVIFCNERGEITEGSITSVFICRQGELLTPPLTCGLLNGVFRGALLAGELVAPGGVPVREQVLTVKDLEEAEAVYVGNSVRGLVWVEVGKVKSEK